ncbi:MAG: bifunctional adenosylcobinamide kinase/adenosylcobinamide-phosphate guanylyltransferase [Serpentinimonas sp.]|nr:bifunctional adenosylcobinamide kinase/adenosylcobinamide-phosphate guanylyltransferase [Serpentinimonas sp.]
MADTARLELILGGQKSGKSRLAEQRAQQWLAGAAGRRALLLATAVPGDAEMRQRIERHQHDRAQRVPGLQTRAVGQGLGPGRMRELALALQHESAPQTLLLVDCLTLWLTQALMPPPGLAPLADSEAAIEHLCHTLAALPGPVLLVGNEIGLGVIPLGAEVRGFVDELGRLNQTLAARADRVTLMVAGCPLRVKGGD